MQHHDVHFEPRLTSLSSCRQPAHADWQFGRYDTAWPSLICSRPSLVAAWRGSITATHGTCRVGAGDRALNLPPVYMSIPYLSRWMIACSASVSGTAACTGCFVNNCQRLSAASVQCRLASTQLRQAEVRMLKQSCVPAIDTVGSHDACRLHTLMNFL